MRLEYWIIGVMIFLVAGVLGLIAASPDAVTVPKPIQTSIEITESISIEEPTSATVNILEGSGSLGCEETDECYVPNEVTILVGGQVTWKNVDMVAHTVTSGNPSDGPDGMFDSSLSKGGTFLYKFDEVGTYEYFCMVHPWMMGTIKVS